MPDGSADLREPEVCQAVNNWVNTTDATELFYDLLHTSH